MFNLPAVKALFISLLIHLLAATSLAAESRIVLTKECHSGVKMVLTFDSDRLVSCKPLEATLVILDAKGKPVSDALIFCSFFMPYYATGSNKPKLKPVGQDGMYKGIVFFERDGDWQANFTINMPEGTYEEVTFDIKNVLPTGS